MKSTAIDHTAAGGSSAAPAAATGQPEFSPPSVAGETDSPMSALAAEITRVEEESQALIGKYLPFRLRGRAPRVEADLDRLPKALADKLAAHNLALDEPVNRGVDPDKDCHLSEWIDPARRKDAWIELGAVGSALPGTLAALFVLGPDSLTNVFLSLVVGIVTGVLVKFAAIAWQRRGPLSISAAEAREIAAHTTVTAPSTFGGSNIREISTQAQALQRLALRAIDKIESSPVWTSGYDDLHRIQLDLDEEAFQITTSAANLAELHEFITDTVPHGKATAAQRELHHIHGDYRRLYSTVRRGLITRVAALNLYLRKITMIEGLLADMATVARFTGTDQLGRYLTQTTLDESAADHLADLGARWDGLREALDAEIGYVSAELLADQSLHLNPLLEQ